MALFLALIATSILISGSQGEVPTSLSTRHGEFKVNQMFDWKFPFWLLQNLPNPHYIGYEKRRNLDELPFTPQKNCDNRQQNLTGGSSGIITSPNYPGNYPPGVRCQWMLESEPGTVIRITFFDVVTQPWLLFFYDFLAVSLDGNWSNFYRLTGDMNRIAPISLQSNDNRVGIRFSSGFDLFNYRGFKMAYVVVKRPLADEGIGNSTNSTATPPVDYGNGNDISATCDYAPVTLPPDSHGEDPTNRIPDGQSPATSNPHEFPFTAVIISDNTKFCSGSLIDESHVLTAAHCTNGSRKIEVFLGVHDMNREEEESRQYRVIDPSQNVIQHPNYEPSTAANDISIIRLTNPVKITAYVQPVYLPSIYSMGNSFKGWKLITMGWGSGNNSSKPEDRKINPVLRKATLPVIPNEQCRKAYRSLITGQTLCVEVQNSNSCFGDSGSPLVARFSRTQNTGEDVPSSVVNDDNMGNQCYFTKSHRDRDQSQEKARPGHSRTSDWFVQIGVLSYGYDSCPSRSPIVYSRTTAYLDFIERALALNS